MTTTATFPLIRSSRHPSWYLPLLLPLLPFLAETLRDAGGVADQEYVMPLALALLGVVITLGLGAILDRRSALVRKEAELLRPAWLACLFLVQIPSLLFWGEEQAVAAFFFIATCALLAALPFGLEFQQRTLTSLLSQPVARSEIWTTKHVVLGVALATHSLAFLLIQLGVQRTPDTFSIAGVALAPLIAWGTGPWWTLLTRRLLPGLVFSLAVPMAGALLCSMVLAELSSRFLIQNPGGLFSDEVLFGLLLFVGGPAYLISAAVAAAGLWRRLEAPDPGVSEGGIFSFAWVSGNTRPEATAIPSERPWWLWQIAKEVRLQTVTLLALAATIVTASGIAVAPDWMLWQYRDLLRGLSLMFAATTVVLAGATPVAEERRLGILDAQLLNPVPRLFQWCLKLALSFLLTLPVAVVSYLVLIGSIPVEGPWLNLGGPLLMIGIALFIPALHMSSGASDPLRALLSSILITAATLTIFAIMAMLMGRQIDQAENRINDQLSESPEAWVESASHLTQAEVAKLNVLVDERAPSADPAFIAGLTLCLLIPVGVSLAFTWRNFARPYVPGRRLTFQALTVVAVLTASLSGGVYLNVGQHVERFRANNTLMAWNSVRFGRNLPESDRQLWEATRPHLFFLAARVNLKVTADEDSEVMISPAGPPIPEPAPRANGRGTPGLQVGPKDRKIQATFRLPLRPSDRRLIIEQGLIPENVREALQAEAIRRGDTGANLPPLHEGLFPGAGEVPARRALAPTEPLQPVPMSPELMRRYGLVPKLTEAPDLPPTAPIAPTTPAPTAPQTSPSQPPPQP